MLIVCSDSLACVEADIWDGVDRQGEQMPGESPHGRITSQVPPHLVDHMDGLDAEHEAFVADEFVQFRGDDTFQPFRIEKRLAELYDRVCRLFTDHVNRINDHRKQCRLNLSLKRLSVNKLGQFGEELHGSQADSPCLILSQVNQRWDQLLIHGALRQDSDQWLQVFNQTHDHLRAVILQQY